MFAKAKPVWLKNKSITKNLQAGFRFDFVADADKEYILRITASTLYRVFINGEFAGYGPARAGHGYIRFDEIALNVKTGINQLAVEVAGYNCSAFYVRAIKSFLCAEVLEKGEVIGYTGRDFNGFSLENMRCMYVSRYSYQRGYSEVWSFDNHDKLSRWIMADGIEYEKLTQLNLEDSFIPRSLPLPDYNVVDAVGVEENGKIIHKEFVGELPRYIKDVSADLSDGYRPEQLSQMPFMELYGDFIPDDVKKEFKSVEIGDDEYVIFKLPCNKSGFLINNITALEDSSVYVFFSEYNYGNGMIFDAFRAQVNIVKYNLKKSDMPYNLESFETYTCQYIGVAVTKGKIVAEVPKIREYCYPECNNAEFEAEDIQLNNIFKAAYETYRQNTLDVFMDCPGRERGGWLCDSYFTAKAERFFTGKSAVEDIFLKNFVMAREFPNLPCGMLPFNYPSEIRKYNDGFIPQWAMWYVIELGEFLRYRSDSGADEYKELCYDILEWFGQYENVDGLLEKMPGWNFIEWSKANDWVQDVNYPSNMLYSKMLLTMGEIFDDNSLLQKSDEVKKRVIEQSFDGEYFIDNAIRNSENIMVLTGNRSETCQYYAYFTGVADTNDIRFEKLTKKMMNVFGPERKRKGEMPEIAFSNAFIGNYLRLIILLQNKCFDKAADDVKGYFAKMAELTGTLWEDDDLEKAKHGGSLNHGFASFAGVALVFAISGISDINYKEKRVIIDKNYISGINFRFKLDTDDGEISVMEENGRKVIEIPQAWEYGG